MTQDVMESTQVRALKGGHLMYFKQPNGHIATASAERMDVSNYVASGWRALPKYGQYPMTAASINYPLDNLFRQKGGPAELPVSQLIEEGYAYRDYFVDGARVEFPQLAGAQIPPQEQCPYCERMGSKEGLKDHMEVVHKEDLAPMKMAEVLTKVFRGEMKNESVAEGPIAGLPYICGFCGQGSNSPVGLGKHVKKEHKNDN